MRISPMSRNRNFLPERIGGYSLIEMMVATVVFVVVIMALGLISLPLSRQREQIEEKSMVL